MNNSFIASENINLELEKKFDNSEILIRQEKEALDIADALKHICESQYWKTLEEKIFKPNVEKLSTNLRKEKNPTEIYRLQGRLEEAEKASKLTDQIQVYLNKVQSIRKQLDE